MLMTLQTCAIVLAILWTKQDGTSADIALVILMSTLTMLSLRDAMDMARKRTMLSRFDRRFP
jgi:hypothetical protein